MALRVTRENKQSILQGGESCNSTTSAGLLSVNIERRPADSVKIL